MHRGLDEQNTNTMGFEVDLSMDTPSSSRRSNSSLFDWQLNCSLQEHLQDGLENR